MLLSDSQAGRSDFSEPASDIVSLTMVLLSSVVTIPASIELAVGYNLNRFYLIAELIFRVDQDH